MKDTNIICDNCESEFEVEIVHSDFPVAFCVFCGESISEEDLEDDEE